MAEKKKKEIIEWYDSPRFISNLMILLIFSIVICSQSFAIGDNYSLKLFGSIINHNTVYMLVLIYFLSLKTCLFFASSFFGTSNISFTSFLVS